MFAVIPDMVWVGLIVSVTTLIGAVTQWVIHKATAKEVKQVAVEAKEVAVQAKEAAHKVEMVRTDLKEDNRVVKRQLDVIEKQGNGTLMAARRAVAVAARSLAHVKPTKDNIAAADAAEKEVALLEKQSREVTQLKGMP
jgi:hypothetical protein